MRKRIQHASLRCIHRVGPDWIAAAPAGGGDLTFHNPEHVEVTSAELDDIENDPSEAAAKFRKAWIAQPQGTSSVYHFTRRENADRT
ncbi:hypothetical protein [Saccharopolyspora griseoalba]|uniref:Uncharacterized protein n=1 Tax=Saccharopolyspora griseoalba TaxID=1431848 RepID=A0ABW2LVA5_9PSEU